MLIVWNSAYSAKEQATQLVERMSAHVRIEPSQFYMYATPGPLKVVYFYLGVWAHDDRQWQGWPSAAAHQLQRHPCDSSISRLVPAVRSAGNPASKRPPMPPDVVKCHGDSPWH